MDWKALLVKQLDDLKDKPLGTEKIWIGLSVENPDRVVFSKLARHLSTVNSHPIAWVGAGYLQLVSVTWEHDYGWIVLQLSPQKKHNELLVEDVFTGVVGKLNLPLYDETDFLSL